MPTITWGYPFDCCFRATITGLGSKDQLLVVFDGVSPPPPDWLLESSVTLLHTGERRGPAAARNLAAAQARNDILLFVDADVELHPDAVNRFREQFRQNPDLQAVFGSYDASPVAHGLVSRFRNLLHHYTHTSQPGPACTFWAGCGAVRRNRFIDLGGFNAEIYHQPCIEDIEFGLRLHDDGGKILLDPTIQGTHHKRWTLGLMVRTDIQQRAIPWSQLLVRRRQAPATLNLSLAARLSALLSLFVPVALAGLAIPALWPWSTVVLFGILIPLFLLNRSFLALLQRQGGLPLTLVGAGLHVLYLLYSSLSLGGVIITELASKPLRSPNWLNRNPQLAKNLVRFALTSLALMAIAVVVKGLTINIQATGGGDLHQRFDEWRLFNDHIYPSGRLASPEQRSLPYFHTTVYLPWALPLFGLLFAWGGIGQGKLVIIVGSLAALALMARVGWYCLRPWGSWAGWLGALTPLAIPSNSSCLALGQFSIICMGLITVQWILLSRQRPIAAGFCWALAMVKPQIAASYAFSFFQKRRLLGLILGLGTLMVLTAVALAHTDTSPLKFLVSWFQVLPKFMNNGNFNAVGGLVTILRTLPLINIGFIVCLLIAVASITVAVGWGLFRQSKANLATVPPIDPLYLAGFCAVAGMLGFYHLHYDNIMLYPALLVCWRSALVTSYSGNFLLALVMAISVWTPQSLLDLLPGSKVLQTLIWFVVAMILLWRILKDKSRQICAV